MRRIPIFIALALGLLPILASGAATVPAEQSTSVAFIANYNTHGTFLGWGSGFFVDEGIVVTNKHVIEGGDWYRVYATGADAAVDLNCFQAISKSDVKINLNDDVAYMRAYVPCAHGKMQFVEDPQEGDRISILGYPYRGSVSASLQQMVSTGSVVGHTTTGWLSTDAHLDVGNSGGPVVNEAGVLGVAVAKGVDKDGNYVYGYFIPSSVILRGLLYANDSGFGYTPQTSVPSWRSSASSSSSVSSSSPASSSASSSVSSRSSSSRSAAVFSDVTPDRAGYAAILSLHDRGIIDGYANGTFQPDRGINRAEFLKILVAGFRSSALREESRCFSDVASEWFAPYVCAAKRLGWINGYPDGTFRPSQLVNRAEAIKILITAFGGAVSAPQRMPSDVRTGAWFYPFVARAVEMGIVNPRLLFHPERDLIREDAAIWIDAAAK